METICPIHGMEIRKIRKLMMIDLKYMIFPPGYFILWLVLR
jgi:hypothetical protein